MTDQVKSMSAPIALDMPIVRDEAKIETIQLRRPKSGELRGLNLGKLTDADVTAALTILPRISVPPITPAEADDLDPADLVSVAEELTLFFATKAKLAQAGL